MYYMNIKFAKTMMKRNNWKDYEWRHLDKTIQEYHRDHGAELIPVTHGAGILKFKKSHNVVLAIDDESFKDLTEN